MKISPVSSAQNLGGVITGADPQGAKQQIRSLKMNTKATPGRIEPQVEGPKGEGAQPALSNPDTTGDANGAVEATEPLSPQLAALAKQRRTLQVKERELADREKALETKATTPVESVTFADLKSEPLSALLKAGVTYEQLTEAILEQKNGHSPEIAALKAEIAALKGDVTKTLSDRDAQAEQQVLAEMRRDATKLVAEGEEFELVRETKSIPQVMTLIERTYRESGEVLDVREALRLVEEDLISESLKLAATKKVQSKLAPEPASPPPQQQRQPQMRTLTNRDTATAPMSAKQRALLAFTGQLKK